MVVEWLLCTCTAGKQHEHCCRTIGRGKRCAVGSPHRSHAKRPVNSKTHNIVINTYYRGVVSEFEEPWTQCSRGERLRRSDLMRWAAGRLRFGVFKVSLCTHYSPVCLANWEIVAYTASKVITLFKRRYHIRTIGLTGVLTLLT